MAEVEGWENFRSKWTNFNSILEEGKKKVNQISPKLPHPEKIRPILDDVVRAREVVRELITNIDKENISNKNWYLNELNKNVISTLNKEINFWQSLLDRAVKNPETVISPVAQKTCPHCGQLLPLKWDPRVDKFCPFCGKEIKIEAGKVRLREHTFRGEEEGGEMLSENVFRELLRLYWDYKGRILKGVEPADNILTALRAKEKRSKTEDEMFSLLKNDYLTKLRTGRNDVFTLVHRLKNFVKALQDPRIKDIGSVGIFATANNVFNKILQANNNLTPDEKGHLKDHVGKDYEEFIKSLERLKEDFQEIKKKADEVKGKTIPKEWIVKYRD